MQMTTIDKFAVLIRACVRNFFQKYYPEKTSKECMKCEIQ